MLDGIFKWKSANLLSLDFVSELEPTIPLPLKAPKFRLDDLRDWVQLGSKCCRKPCIWVLQDARPTHTNQQLSTSFANSGPGGRRFESSLPDHSSFFALFAIRSNGFL